MNINFIWCSFIHSNFLLDQLSRSTLILTHAYIQRYLPWSWPSFCCFWSEWCVCVLCKMQVIIIIPQMVKFRWNPSLSIHWCLLVGMVFCFKFFFFFTFDHHHHCFNWPCVFVFVRGPTNKRKKEKRMWSLNFDGFFGNQKKNTFIAFFAWTIKIFVLPFFFVSYFVFSFWPQTWLSTVTTPWPHWRYTHTQKLYCRISDIFSTTTKYRFRYSLFFSKECFSMFFLDDDSVKTIKTKHIYTIETSLWWWWWWWP